jgi:hypothetical protein
MVEIFFVKIILYFIDNYYIWPLVFCWQVHITTMFNLSPITTTKMTMTMNDVAVQNMLLLTNNILPHKTCLKPKAWFLIKLPIIFFGSTHGTPTLVDFYTYVELNKYTIFECPCGNACDNDDMWIIVDMVGIYFCQSIFWHVIKICQGIFVKDGFAHYM